MISKIPYLIIYIFLTKALLLLSTSQESGLKKQLKILIESPSMAFSHMQFQGRLADVLVEAGHEVHILMLNIDQQWANYTGSTKAQKVLRIDRPQNNKMAMEELREELLPNPFKYVDSGAKMWSGFNRFLAGFCEDLVNNKELMDSLKAEKYDVGIAEMYSPCVFAIFHYIGVKTKLASYAIPLTGMAGSLFGIPTISSYVPNIMRPTINGANMEFWQRAVNLYTNIEEILTVRNEDIEIMQPIVNNAFSSSFPSMKEIRKNISLIFVNSDLLLEHPHPISNKVINIGGIVRSKGKPLCKKIKTILDSSDKGTVLFSLGSGTNTSLMSIEMKKAFLGAFSLFPDHSFLWKFDLHDNDKKLFSSVANVYCFNWLDQKTIIEHPKLVAFMTHCGMNSMNEAALAGVPIIALPLFGDQLHNAALMVERGVAEYINILEAEDEKIIVNALQKILYQPSYKDSAKVLQKKLILSPFTPEEKFVKWVEFAAEFPEFNELNLPGEEFGFIAYYSLDVIFVAFVVASLFFLQLL